MSNYYFGMTRILSKNMHIRFFCSWELLHHYFKFVFLLLYIITFLMKN